MEENQKTNNDDILVPVNFMCIAGNNQTPPENRLSYSQLTFITPEQWRVFIMRFDDLVRTLNEFSNNNAKENNNGESE